MTAKARQQLADALRSTRRGRYPVAPKAERTLGSQVFDSKRELQRYAQLKQREIAGQITHLERQPTYKVSIQGKHYCTYRADFKYFESGEYVVEDVKSSGSAKEQAYRLRKRAAELAYHIKVREVLL